MPTTYWTYLIGAPALSGIFPLAGFWSKDEIIAHSWFTRQLPSAAIILIFTSILTAFYMGRQVALIFFGKPRTPEAEHAHESGPVMRWPLIVLAIGAVLAGAINLPGLHWLGNYLEPVLAEQAPEFTIGNAVLAVVTTLFAIGSAYLGWYLYAHALENRIKPGKEDPGYHYLGDIWRGAELGWGFDWFYNRVVLRGYQALSAFLSNVFDAQGIDGILVDGVGRVFGWLARVFRGAQSGYVRNYALVFLVGVLVIVGYFTLR